MTTDPAHRQSIGSLQPVGLVVSAPALAAAGAYVNKNIVREQQVRSALRSRKARAEPGSRQSPLRDLPAFCRDFLAWAAADLAGAPGGPELPRSLDVALPHTPSAAVRYGQGRRDTPAGARRAAPPLRRPHPRPRPLIIPCFLDVRRPA